MSEVTLGGVCIEVIDCEHKTAPEDPFGEYWSIGTPAMGGNKIDYALAKRISEPTFHAWTRRGRPRPNDIILAREAPVGLVVRVPDSRVVALGQRTVLLRPDPNQVDPGFLYYALTGDEMQALMRSRAEGSTVAHLNVAEVRELRLIPFPSLAEQRAIAGVLGALDDKIESNRRIASTCEGLLATMAALGSAGPLVPLGELAHSTRTPVDPQSLGETPVDHFSIPAFDNHRLPEPSSAATIMSGKFVLERRSVLVSRLNPSTPRVWLADPSTRLAMCSTEFLVLHPKDHQRMSTVWLAVVSDRFEEEAERRATGTSFSHQRIKPDDALSIEVPDTRLLDGKLRAEADAWLERALLARRESAAAAALRDTLLPELLSGRLRVREAEEMVGSV